MLSNVPDDWNMYYLKCSDCGARYHMSEGGCGCYEDRFEQLWGEITGRLEDPSCKIEDVQYENVSHYIDDELGKELSKGDMVARVYIDEANSSDELIFCTENWLDIKKHIGYKELEEE